MVLELERELRDAQAQAASSRREFTTHIERLEEELANNKNSGSVSSKREQELLAEVRGVVASALLLDGPDSSFLVVQRLCMCM